MSYRYKLDCNRTVYFIRAGASGPIKIGYTVGNPMKRLADIQGYCPEPLHLLATMPGCNAYREGDLHYRFRHLRVRGEWFSPAPELLGYIAANANLTERHAWLGSECDAVASTG